MKKTVIFSVGGSIVVPEDVDTGYIKSFKNLIDRYLGGNPERRVILVVGGGRIARKYQSAYREIVTDPDSDEQDWIGISATHLNARLLKAVFADSCLDPVVTNPTRPPGFEGRVLIAAGWKPGFSTDFDAVVLAEHYGAKTVINLTNIARVHTADPRIDPDARPLDSMTWRELRELVGSEWVPGKNVPFDPVAAKRASEIGLQVISAEGRNLDNLEAILEGRSFVGTVIGPA